MKSGLSTWEGNALWEIFMFGVSRTSFAMFCLSRVILCDFGDVYVCPF